LNIIQKVLIFTLALFFAQSVSAQIIPPCVDSNRANPFFHCNDPAYIPVCGCDGVTYRNNCEATNIGGVNNVVSSGVCQNSFYHIDIYPTMVNESFRFNMQFAPQQSVSATLQIMNSFGNLVYTELLNNVNSDFPYSKTILTAVYETGVYFVIVQAGGVYKIEKFIKHSL